MAIENDNSYKLGKLEGSVESLTESHKEFKRDITNRFNQLEQRVVGILEKKNGNGNGNGKSNVYKVTQLDWWKDRKNVVVVSVAVLSLVWLWGYSGLHVAYNGETGGFYVGLANPLE